MTAKQKKMLQICLAKRFKCFLKKLPVAAHTLEVQRCSTLSICAAVINIISNALRIIIINFLSIADNI